MNLGGINLLILIKEKLKVYYGLHVNKILLTILQIIQQN